MNIFIHLCFKLFQNFGCMKSNKNIDKDYQEEVKCTELPFNAEQTMKIENSLLYVKYKKWLKDNGVLMDPRIRYPSYFGEAQKGVVGVSANKAIEKKRAIIAVPYSMLITVDKVREIEELSQIIKENLNIFRNDEEAAFKTLILYMSYELLKEQKSFYYPYFAISNEEHLNGWSNWTLYMLEHRGVIVSVKQQKQEIEKQFMHFLRIYRRYEKVFPQNLSNNDYKALFERSYGFIITRAFGWSLPSISLIPLADSLNHSNIRYVNHYVINCDEQKKKTPGKSYEEYSKKVNLAILKDQSLALNQEELGYLRKEKQSKVYKFVEKHNELLLQSQKLLGIESEKNITSKKSELRSKQFHILHQQYKAGIHKLKNLHFYQSSCSEDNDTDQDELFERELKQENFKLEDRQRVISEASKKKQIKKLWGLYYDNVDDQQEEDEQEETVLPKIKEGNKQLQKEIEDKLNKQGDSSSVSSEETDEEDQIFDWINTVDNKKTYFIMSTKQIIRENEQIYNFYGRRCNKFLLLGYNFVMKDNIYDSFGLKIKLDPKFITRVPASKLIEGGSKKEESSKSRQLHLKRYLIHPDLISICRSYIILWTKKEWNSCRLTLPFDRDIEGKTLDLYQQIIKYLLKEFTTSIEEDEELEENNNLKYEERVAIAMRKQYKKILLGQDLLVSKCLNYLKKWKVKGAQDFDQSDMKWIKRIKTYLLALEQTTSL